MINYKKYIEEYKDFPIEGINYLDINPLYKDNKLRTELVMDCISVLKNTDINKKSLWHTEFDYIGVVESRGFLIGSILADRLHKGIVLLRSKKNRLPGQTYTVEHKLEYGESIVQVQEGKGKESAEGKDLKVNLPF